jgi:uncharacterized protein YmfQ (DUF2313 family)
VSNNKDVLRLLFPLGLGGALEDDLAVDGRSLDAAEARAEDILEEMFADRTYELLEAWERVCGLSPSNDAPLQSRISGVVRKLRDLGDIKRPYLISLAADLGYAITIEDYTPFMAGWNRAGDEIYIADAIYIWRVTLLDFPAYYFRAGASAAGERLCWWVEGGEELETKLNDIKPAEVYLHFVNPET